jgi:formamidopyrimidine-DNA glycosylase
MVDEPLGAALEGRLLEGVSRRGHFMRFQLEGERVIVINAMLVGRYRLVDLLPEAARSEAPVPRSLGLGLDFEGGVGLQYLDEKRMGKVYVAPADREREIPIYGQLGVEVLSPAFTRELFTRLLRKRRDQVRVFLMDKKTLASIGNAYADEILFAARIHPKTFCNKLSPDEIEALYLAIPSVLRHAIDEIARRDQPVEVKVRDFLAVRGRDGKPCPRCATTIRAVRVGAGDACFCPKCQPAARKLFVDWGSLPPR